jgi:hypothetical protein
MSLWFGADPMGSEKHGAKYIIGNEDTGLPVRESIYYFLYYLQYSVVVTVFSCPILLYVYYIWELRQHRPGEKRGRE